MSLLDLALSAIALPVLGCAIYLAVLAVLARARPAPPLSGPPRIRFDILVPAHNEELGIAPTVASLRSIDYPPALFRVRVIADNCVDRTAAVAAAAGADVLVRNDTRLRGKGHALAFAFKQSLADGIADAVVVIDADTVVTPNLLRCFAARLEGGAPALQAAYGVRNPLASWRTRLLTIALAAFHGVRSLARERMNVSCGLRGNGMAFTARVLRDHPPNAFSIVEDLEYGIQLGYAGIRVGYVADAEVLGEMAVTETSSRSQRRRWERGRRALVRLNVPSLLKQAVTRRDRALLDLALDLMVPPIGGLVLYAVLGLGLSLGIAAVAGHVAVAPWVWAAALAGITVHVLRGWSLSGVGAAGLLDLLWAPGYIAWKLSLRFRDRGKLPEEWVRTTREVRS